MAKTYEVYTIINPSLQMAKLRLKAVEQLVFSQVEFNQDYSPGSWINSTLVLSHNVVPLQC